MIVSVIQLYSFLNLLNILGAHCATLTVKLMNVWNQPTGVSRWAAGQRLGARGAAVKGGAGSQAEKQGHSQPAKLRSRRATANQAERQGQAASQAEKKQGHSQPGSH